MATKLERFYKTIPNIYNPQNNNIVNGIVQAWAQEDESIVTQLTNTKEQLFVETATSKYLTRLGLNVDVNRPLYVPLSDTYFKELIVALSYAPKQVRKTMYDVLDVFWGPTYSRANITSSSAESYNLGSLVGLTGTASFTEDSNVIEGVGTLFTSELSVGDYIKLSSADNDTFLRIINIVSDTNLVVDTPYGSTTTTGSASGYTAKTLTLEVDGADEQTITLSPIYFSDTTAATAEEVADAISASLDTIVGSTVLTASSSSGYVNIRTNTTGSHGSIQVTGGTANSILNFSTSLNTIDSLAFSTIIYEINPREIVLKIPNLVAKLERSLKGAIHLHNNIEGTIVSVNNTTKTAVVNLSESVDADELIGHKLAMGIESFTITDNTSGQNAVTLTFDSGDDLSNLLYGVYTEVIDDPSTAWAIAHNFNSQWNNVAAYDINNKLMSPSSIVATDANTTTYNFASGEVGRAYVIKRDYLKQNLVVSASVLVNHQLNDDYPIVTCYTAPFGNTVNTPSNIVSNNANTLTVSLSPAQMQRIAVTASEYQHTQSSSSNVWTVEHNLNTNEVMVQCYNNAKNMITPTEVLIVDQNTVQITFSGNQTGVAGVARSASADLELIDPEYPNSYVFNPKAVFQITSRRTILNQDIDAGTNPVVISVEDASDIPNEPGYLYFNFGRNNGEQLVPYVSRPNNNTLILDSSYIFEESHLTGEIINYIPELSGYEPRDDGSDYAAYITGTQNAIEVVKSIIERIKAVGVVLRWIIDYPEYNFEC